MFGFEGAGKCLKRFRWRCVCGKHPYPYRTRRLRHRRLMILGWRRPGKVSGCRDINKNIPGCSVAWLARLIWDQEVAGSNPVTPTLTFLVSPVAEGKTVGFIYCKIKSNIGIICISSSAG